MKKLIKYLTALALVVTLSGCGNNQEMVCKMKDYNGDKDSSVTTSFSNDGEEVSSITINVKAKLFAYQDAKARKSSLKSVNSKKMESNFKSMLISVVANGLKVKEKTAKDMIDGEFTIDKDKGFISGEFTIDVSDLKKPLKVKTVKKRLENRVNNPAKCGKNE